MLLSLKPGSVYYMEEDGFQTSVPHYLVVLNVNPSTGDVLVLVNATSNLEGARRREQVYGYQPGVLVFVGADEYEHFTVDSVFDCNDPLLKRTEHLSKLHFQGRMKFREPMPLLIVERLRQGALLGRGLEEKYKALLREGRPGE